MEIFSKEKDIALKRSSASISTINTLGPNNCQLQDEVLHYIIEDDLGSYLFSTHNQPEELFYRIAEIIYTRPLVPGFTDTVEFNKSRRVLQCEETGNVRTFITYLLDLHKLYIKDLKGECSISKELQIGITLITPSWINPFIKSVIDKWNIHKDYPNLSEVEFFYLVLLKRHYTVFHPFIGPSPRRPKDKETNAKKLLHLCITNSTVPDYELFAEEEFCNTIIQYDAYNLVLKRYPPKLSLNHKLRERVVDRIAESGSKRCDIEVLNKYTKWSTNNGFHHNVCLLVEAIRNGNDIKSVKIIDNCQLCQVRIPRREELGC